MLEYYKGFSFLALSRRLHPLIYQRKPKQTNLNHRLGALPFEFTKILLKPWEHSSRASVHVESL